MSSQILVFNTDTKIILSIFWSGYHGLLYLGDRESENVNITNNYFDGSGITRSWHTSSIFSTRGINILIAHNEVTRSLGNAIFLSAESLSKNWSDDDDDVWNVKIEFNYIHDFGMGIISDFGGIKPGSNYHACDTEDLEGLESNCYTFTRVYNNLVRDGWPYYCCANYLYSDVSASKNLFENNVLYGSGGGALYHHCGLENESKNNYVHRQIAPENGKKALSNVWGACEVGMSCE